MTRTPLKSTSISSGSPASPLPEEANSDSEQPVDTDQKLLEVMQKLNLAVAVVAQAREKRP